MKLYIRLAVTNLRNNRRTYVPYILTAILRIMMFFMIDTLGRIKEIAGDGSMKICLQYATGILVVFSVIFLFYTNSFLIKRRKKEIGVYNILGMGKFHIAKMMGIESLLISGISLLGGIGLGSVCNRLMYLIYLKILHQNAKSGIVFSRPAGVDTLVVFCGIFFLTYLYNIIQIRLSNPVELLHGGNAGEREPKTKWLMTIFGLVTLLGGYYLALTTKEPLAALGIFFVAAILVIIGTYALFTAGSIVLLKMLKKNKRYYYKANHFTAVSGMIYRMKQNAVGLANICILSTMVIVLVSMTVSLYAGMSDILAARFPSPAKIEIFSTNEEEEQQVKQILKEETEKENVKVVSEITYHGASFMADFKEGTFSLKTVYAFSGTGDNGITMIPVDEYNQMENQNISLNENEALVYCTDKTYGKSQIAINGKTYQVKKELKNLKAEPKSKAGIYGTTYVILSDLKQIREFSEEAIEAGIQSGMEEENIRQRTEVSYSIGFDLQGEKKDCKKVLTKIQERLNEYPNVDFESRILSEKSFYGLYGSFFFVGIYLGILFIVATVLIIYYKQISEGYDDKERFKIMQKVGMSKREVKKAIHSQVLSVFFLPLGVAIVHIAVAFPVMTKLLAVLNLSNVELFAKCTIASVAVFAVFYVVVYGVTAKEYYRIVN